MFEFGREPRILITRLSAIGDCVHAIPLVAAIRERFPGAYLGWATQEKTAELLRGMPELNTLITVDRKWLTRPHLFPKIRKQLRSHKFDVTIDPQCLLKSSLLGWLSDAPVRIGFDGKLGREGSRLLNNKRVMPTQVHVVDRYLELLRPLGIQRTQPTFPVPVCANSESRIAAFLLKHQLEDFVILNPGAGWPSKLWPHDRYVSVANHLDQRGIPSVVLWAGAEERRLASDIAARSPAILAPNTTLNELAALCRRAQLFVGSDTGPTHLAAAVGTCCIAMYGPTSSDVCGPYGHQHIRLQAFEQKVSHRSRRTVDNLAMQAISVNDVMDAYEATIDRAPNSPINAICPVRSRCASGDAA